MAARQTRAEKHGISAEAEKKALEKFDPALATEILAWINEVSGQELNTEGTMENLCNQLRSGEALCKLANKCGGRVKCAKSNLAFKQMENINNFLSWAENSAGIHTSELFVTVDLYEAMNPAQVLLTLAAVARNGEKFGVRAIKGKGAPTGNLD